MTSSILIVEDESIVARDIQECLLSFGYKVTGVVSSGEEAIKAVAEERPDLVLMDIVLNGNVDGIDAAHEIRTRFGVPVVYLTAYADDKTLERAKVTEPFGYIVKPFDERELHSTVEIALYKAKSEKKLKESEIWFSTTLKSLGDGVIATDPEGEVVFLNHAAEGITGWRQQDAVGRPMHEIFYIINEHTRQRVENPAAKVLREGRVVGLANHTILITRQGTEVPIDDSAAPIRDDKGNLLGIVMVFREIIKRKKAEKALAAEKELLSVTLRSIGDGLITTDTRGRVMLVNEKAEQLCGWRQDEALDKPVNEIFKIVNEKNRRELENPVEIVLRTGSTTPLINNTLLISRDGTERIIAEKGAPIRDLDDTVVGVVLIFRDITPERRMEEELEKARKIKSLGILAGGIAHDFNNILTAVIGNISLAKANASPETKYYECLGNAEKAGLRARDLTQQLITFSKGGAPLMRSASIEEIIRDTAQFVLQGANVSSSFSFADDLWLCEIDEGQVSQVISNLVINANQAMSEGGVISIAAENMTVGKGANLPLKQGKYVKITVADHGEGISPENLPKIFDPYFSTKQAG
ncbi:MAG: PAS domain S-box protein, partial [Desulfobulbaceae bacterium]|nr:PAS domain S-box protein [Desulfobulbaceae bacterium]